jgi:hypothetical protein
MRSSRTLSGCFSPASERTSTERHCPKATVWDLGAAKLLPANNKQVVNMHSERTVVANYMTLHQKS